MFETDDFRFLDSALNLSRCSLRCSQVHKLVRNQRLDFSLECVFSATTLRDVSISEMDSDNENANANNANEENPQVENEAAQNEDERMEEDVSPSFQIALIKSF